MDEEKIIDLYWERSDRAIAATQEKYGPYCYRIAYNILTNNEDVEECVNDTWLKAWSAIPPKRPNNLATFLGKITRNLAINQLREKKTKKRGNGQITLVLEELEECIAHKTDVEQIMEVKSLSDAINQFISTLSKEERNIFVCRYWYMDSIAAIAGYAGASQSKVKSILYRTRKKLKVFLEQEGHYVGEPRLIKSND